MLDLTEAGTLADKKQDYWKKVHLIKKYLVEDKGVAPCSAAKIAKDLIKEKEGVRLSKDAEYMAHVHDELYSDSVCDEDVIFWKCQGISNPSELEGEFKRINGNI